MTLGEFERQVYAVANASPICGIPLLRRLTTTSINLRLDIVTGDLVDVFFNEETGTTAYAVVRNGKRIFGADNTGGWHIHPWQHPNSHENLTEPMSFDSFVEAVEQRLRDN
jgi:Ethanolamine utilization protein EutJ (predicted chaperonin)